MEVISTIEPLRRFQTDPQYKIKIEAFRKRFSPEINYGNQKLRGFSLPLNIPMQHVKNLRDLQGAFYKYNVAINRELLFIDFWYNSRQIFQFDSYLSEALFRTDIYDVPWSEIRLPYDNFYISFGNSISSSFILANGWEYMIDGAYVKFVERGQSVILNESSIMIDFTSRLMSPDYETAINDDSIPGLIFSEPIYSFTLSGEPADTVKDAIERGEMNTIKHCEEMDRMNYENSLKYAKEMDTSGMESVLQSFTKDKYFRGKDVILPSLKVLFNCIFYLTEYPENIHIKYNDHKAKVLYKTLDRTSEATKREKIKKEINNGEFSRIKVVKDSKIINLYDSLPTGKELKTHWRKGHWRNQSYGEKKLKHKFIWIHPTIVNKDKGNPESGHIYEVIK